MPRKISAGILPFRRGRVPEFFLVHPGGPYWAKKDDNAWSVAKGELDPGEDALAAARREFQEETGVDLGRHALADFLPLAPLKQLLIRRGNPFFLEETVRTLVETRALAGERGRYRLMQPIQMLQVPPTVQAMLAARIDRLAPEDKRLLQSAAVIGPAL